MKFGAEDVRARLLLHQELVQRAMDEIAQPLAEAISRLERCLYTGGKVLSCGNGGSAADAQHFATELVVQYRKKRRAFPAIALTTDTSLLTAAANDRGFDSVFARQIEALGQEGDLLLAISTSGNSENVILACQTALRQGLGVIVLTGESGGRAGRILSKDALVIRAPGDRADLIQEIHLLIIHILCDAIEQGWESGPEL